MPNWLPSTPVEPVLSFQNTSYCFMSNDTQPGKDLPNIRFYLLELIVLHISGACLHIWQAIFLSLILVKHLLTLVATLLRLPGVENVFVISLLCLSKTNDDYASLSNHLSQPIFTESQSRRLGCFLFLNLHSRLR